jgi:hypothetical protein
VSCGREISAKSNRHHRILVHCTKTRRRTDTVQYSTVYTVVLSLALSASPVDIALTESLNVGRSLGIASAISNSRDEELTSHILNNWREKPRRARMYVLITTSPKIPKRMVRSDFHSFNWYEYLRKNSPTTRMWNGETSGTESAPSRGARV